MPLRFLKSGQMGWIHVGGDIEAILGRVGVEVTIIHF